MSLRWQMGQINNCKMPFIPSFRYLNEEVVAQAASYVRFILREPGAINQCKTVQNGVESVVLHDLGHFPVFALLN